MKRYIILLPILVAALVLPTLVGAQGENLPGAGWWTGQQIQNVGTSNATIVSMAYDANGSATYMASAGPIAPWASATFLPTDFSGMPNGFAGSAIVSSDSPIKAIVNVGNRLVGGLGTPGGLAGAQYQGIDGSAASTTIRFPIVKADYGSKLTTLFIQNAGSAAAAVHAVYTCGANTYTQDTASIQPGRMAVLTPRDVVPQGQLCSGTLTSPQAVAGVAIETWTTETVATLAQATRAFTSQDYANIIYAPIFKKRYPMTSPTDVRGRTTGAQVQNVGGADITVTATYYFVGGTCPSGTWSETSTTITPGGYYTFFKPTGLADGCLASAKFQASGSGQIVGIVSESFQDPIAPKGTQSATSYNMISDQSKTALITVPLYKEKFGGKTTGLQVQNVGTTSATFHLEFRSGANTWTTVDKTVAAGASYTFFQVSDDPSIWNGTAMPAGTNAAVRVISTGGTPQPVIAIANESTYPNCFGGTNCFDRANYEGFNINP